MMQDNLQHHLQFAHVQAHTKGRVLLGTAQHQLIQFPARATAPHLHFM